MCGGSDDQGSKTAAQENWCSSSTELGVFDAFVEISRNLFLTCSLALPTLSIANTFETTIAFPSPYTNDAHERCKI